MWIMGGRALLRVFLKVWDRSGCQSIGINPQTPHKSKIIHYKFSASLSREKCWKKLIWRTAKTEQGCDFTQPSLLNIPLLWQDLHGKCIWKWPGSLTSPWQMMDGSNAAPRIQNDQVQERRGWVTAAKEMSSHGDLHSRRLHHLFLHGEDNEWGDSSRNSFPARNIGLTKTSRCFCVCVSSLVNTGRGLRAGIEDSQFSIRFGGWKSCPGPSPAIAAAQHHCQNLPKATRATSEAACHHF